MRPGRIYTVEAIVLKRKNTGEADRILTIFTRQRGKIRALAKGIRKIHSRRAGHVEVFCRVFLTLHTGGSMDIVSEAQSVDSGFSFLADERRIAYAYAVCELVDQLLAEGQEQQEIYDYLVSALNALSRDGVFNLDDFVHDLLWDLGYLPKNSRLSFEALKPYVEHITERKLKAWP